MRFTTKKVYQKPSTVFPITFWFIFKVGTFKPNIYAVFWFIRTISKKNRSEFTLYCAKAMIKAVSLKKAFFILID